MSAVYQHVVSLDDAKQLVRVLSEGTHADGSPAPYYLWLKSVDIELVRAWMQRRVNDPNWRWRYIPESPEQMRRELAAEQMRSVPYPEYEAT